ncbi:hypothetical protein FRB98_002327 [Tulasnella sp. 332]|nr:hypothetical protein FRB98_002327 [Tulasnella sp. 332]
MNLSSDATQGYEPLAVLSANYNTTQRFWYTPFLLKQISSHTLCDAHVFSVGDTFQTSQGTFDWSLDYLTKADSTTLNVNAQGYNYSGGALLPGTCAISTLQVSADLPTWTVTAIANIQCDGNSSFPVSASTSFVSSVIAEKASLDSNRLQSPIRSADPEAQNQWATQVLLQIAGLDILTTLRMNTNLLATSVSSFTVYWPLDINNPPPPCGLTAVGIDTVGFSNMTLSQSSAAFDLINTIFVNTTSNFMQTLMAAVNLDIGSPCQSFLTHPPLAQQLLYDTPDLQDDTASQYYASSVSLGQTFRSALDSTNAFLDEHYGFTFPLYAIDFVYIDAAYLCHLSERKSVISFLIAIVSSTYALFKTGWGAAMLVVLFFAPKPVNPNYCDGHAALEEQLKSLSNNTPLRGSTNSGYFQAMPNMTLTHHQGEVQMPTPQDDIREKV